MIKYMITNGHGSYIRHDVFSNKYVPVKNQSMGDVYDQRHIAANILKNSLGKKLRSQYMIVEITQDKSNHERSKAKSAVCNKRKEQEEYAKTIAAREIGEDKSDRWSDDVETIARIISDSEKRREELNVALSEVDLEISDIYHYIEFGKFNAYQGWLAFNMLRNALRKRRVIKNEMQVLRELGNCKITSDMMVDINNAIDRLKEKRYAPRVLNKLFE